MKAKSLLVLMLLLAGTAAWAGEDHAAAAPPADERFAFLKQLEGSWSGEPAGEGMLPSTIEFRVTAGGHSVEEREFAGTPMEMVTLYYMEGSDLVATHYCMIGNRPRLRAARQVVDGSLSFACDGKPGNATSHDDEHVHAWSIKLDAEGRLHYAAELAKDGKIAEKHAMVLTRLPRTASR